MLADLSLTVNDKAEMTTEVLGDDKLLYRSQLKHPSEFLK